MFANILRLGIKELRSLFADRMLLAVIAWAFTIGIYAAATGMSQELHNAPIAFVDLDRSPLSAQLADAFGAPYFQPPRTMSLSEMDLALDRGEISFAVVLPEHFQRDYGNGARPRYRSISTPPTCRNPSSARAISSRSSRRSSTTAATARRRPAPLPGYPGALQSQPHRAVVRWRDGGHQQRHHAVHHPGRRGLHPRTRARYARAHDGDADQRLRDHGEQGVGQRAGGADRRDAVAAFHGSAGDAGAGGRLLAAVRGCGRAVPAVDRLDRHFPGHPGAFDAAVRPAHHPRGDSAAVALGGVTPRESMPVLVQNIMDLAPTPHFISLAQAVLFRGAGFELVWQQFLAIAAIGLVFFLIALARMRKTVAQVH